MSATVEAPLTTAEQKRFTELDAVIREGMKTFTETGCALIEMRDRKLYRSAFGTFEEYCRAAHGMSRSYAYEVMQAAQIHDVLSGTPDIPPPANARVAFELAPLADQPERLRETWEKITTDYGATPTSQLVREVVRGKPTLASAPPPAPAEPAGDPEHDTRFEVLEDVVEMVSELMPPPEQCVFPTEPGDVETVDEAVKFLADWAPRLAKAWRAHKAQLRQQRAAA